jgi:hypothetical protein
MGTISYSSNFIRATGSISGLLFTSVFVSYFAEATSYSFNYIRAMEFAS